MSDIPENPSDQQVADEWAAALAESGDESSDSEPHELAQEVLSDAAISPEAVESAQFQNLGSDDSQSIPADANLDVILDIPVTLSMEIGRTMISIRNLLQLNQGSIVELDRLAGEPMDVLVNGTLVAHGEVVVVNEKFGIRLTDVISPTERVKKLK